LVEIVEDWSALVEHARYCRVMLYRVDRTPTGYRLRVRVGSFGWDKELSEKELNEKEAYLRQVGAVKVVESVPDELFFA
jgi:hypothetical protein